MRLVSALLLLMLTLPAMATAGAWPREHRSAFVSLSTNFSTAARSLDGMLVDLRNVTSLYAEYGLTPKLTVGAEASKGSGDSEEGAVGLVFARYPIWTSEGGHRFAAGFGIGLREETDFPTQWRFRPGLAWGYGFESRWGGGWLGVDASYERRIPSNTYVIKADFTAGIRPRDRWMAIFQVQSSREDAGTIVKLAPSVVREISERTSLQLGATAGVKGDDTLGVKLGVWFRF
ncbi:hypothetical protein [Amaricoccus tamworthensis]|uniref:hypothetical protein n=1 Tax=Amaricoccus tamworthensis TaxID=57002 RepID=UPI003C7E7E67